MIRYFGEYFANVYTVTTPTYPSSTVEDVTVTVFPHDPDGDGINASTMMVTVDGGASLLMNAGPNAGQFSLGLHLSGIPGAQVLHTLNFSVDDDNPAGALTGTTTLVVAIDLPLVAEPPPVSSTPPPVIIPGPAPRAVNWTIVHYDHDGNQVADYEPADLQFGTFTNQPGYFNGILHLQHSAARRKFAEPHVHDWILYRNNIPLLGGILTGAQTDSDSRMLQLAGNTWDIYFDSIVMPYDQDNPIDKHYYNKDLFVVTEGIASYILGSYKDSLSLTMANGLSGINVPAQHFIAAELNTLSDIISSLGQMNPGFDYEVTWDKQLKLYTPQRGSQLDFTISLATEQVSQWHYEINGVRGTTEYGRGTPATATAQITVQQDNPGAAKLYRHRDVIVDYSTVKSQKQLGQLVNSDLQDAIKQVYSFKITLVNPAEELYGLIGWGDSIKINTDGLMDYDNFSQEYFRITGLEGYVNDRGQEQVVVTLGQF